jgi:DNA-binding NarL/FixJ family response regulator
MNTGEGIRLLLVDDSPVFCRSMQLLLQLEGFQVRCHIHAREAAHPGALDDIDCIIVDYSMADMNGIALLRKVRARLPSLPALLLTGMRHRHIGIEANALPGSCPVLYKPVDSTTVIAGIHRELARWRSSEPASAPGLGDARR